MSLYSEMMGSFIRTGNYPLEANYIFPTEAELKSFFSDPLNATLLHKGLLKIVENDGTGQLALYWVLKKQTNDELEFTKLINGNNTAEIYSNIETLVNRLDEEIRNRLNSDTAIWGTNDSTNVPEELNSLLDISVAIEALRADLATIHQELIDADDSIEGDLDTTRASLKLELKATVGTELDDIIAYLRTLPYTSLSVAITALDNFLNYRDSTSNSINTLPELKFFLEGYNDSLKLYNILMDLKGEISGTPLPTREFETLRAIEDFVRVFKSDSENTDENLQSELDRTQIGVGLSGDGSYNADKTTNYLGDATSVMNALKTLDGLMKTALEGITITVNNDDVVDLNARKELEGYVISARLNISNVIGNDLVKKSDGVYLNIRSTYENGVLGLYVNDKLVSQHILGLSNLVKDAVYRASDETIVITFKLATGGEQVVNIPVGGLIREWDVDNSIPDKVVELERTVVVDGQDKLSADVRLSNSKYQILQKTGNSLFVKGTSDNIVHNDVKVSDIIEQIKTTEITNYNDALSKINTETTRAVSAETTLLTYVDAETTRATGVEETIKTNLADNVSELNTKITANASEIVKEEKRATDAETALGNRISDLEASTTTDATNLANEITRATTRENSLETSILTEQNRALLKEQDLQNQVTAEITRAGKEETDIKNNVSLLTTTATNLTNQVASLNTLIENKIETIDLVSDSDNLVYNFLVDGVSIGSISLRDLKTLLDTKAPTDSPILTGVPQVETSPDEDDSSLRIPSTNWVNNRISTEVAKVSTDNFYTKLEINDIVDDKADKANTYTKLEVSESLDTKLDVVTFEEFKTWEVLD